MKTQKQKDNEQIRKIEQEIYQKIFSMFNLLSLEKKEQVVDKLQLRIREIKVAKQFRESNETCIS